MDPHCVWALRNEGTARHASRPCGCDVPCQRPSPPRANRPRARKPPHAHARGTGPCARRITRPCRSRERCQVEAEDPLAGPPAGAGLRAHGLGAGNEGRERGRVKPEPSACHASLFLPTRSRALGLAVASQGQAPVQMTGSFPVTAAGQLRNGRAHGAPSPDSRLIHRFMWMKRWNHDERTLRAGSRARQGDTARASRNDKGPSRGLVVVPAGGPFVAAAQPTPVGPSST
jgi:hypothetical protein